MLVKIKLQFFPIEVREPPEIYPPTPKEIVELKLRTAILKHVYCYITCTTL